MKDYKGIEVGLLKAIKFSKRVKNHTFWIFACKCGIEKEYRVDNVFKKGKIKSCGCNTRIKIKGLDSYELIYYKRYVKWSKERNLCFNLKPKEFIYFISKNCFYCNIPPYKKINKSLFCFNGIDRVDNNIGYEYKNCVPCCEICNKAKRDLSYDDFITWINRLINFRKYK